MGLVKTRRLAAMQKARLRGGFGAASSAKAAMKPPMKGGAGKGLPRQFAPAVSKVSLRKHSEGNCVF